MASVGEDRDVDVFVAGAGPVGMFAALALAERGIRVHIVDQYRRAALHSYALALHPQTLRLFDEVGIAGPLLDIGQVVRRVTIHPWDRTLELAPIRGAHPYVLVVSQHVLEAVLEQRLADAGVQVHWGHQLLAFGEAGPGITALVARTGEPIEDGSDVVSELPTESWRARYLVGADGYNSLTRRLLGIEHEAVGDGITLGLLEFEADVAEPETFALVVSDKTTDALWPLGPGRARWSVELGSPEEGASPADLERILRGRAPWFGTEFGTIEWCSTVGFEPRLARSWGKKHAWLVGDAARFTSPLGVQSLNVGLREAHDLARRIADILTEGGSTKLLRYYQEERQREWKMLLGLKDRLRVSAAAPAWVAPVAARLVRSLPATGHDLNVLLEQLGLRLHWLRGRSA